MISWFWFLFFIMFALDAYDTNQLRQSQTVHITIADDVSLSTEKLAHSFICSCSIDELHFSADIRIDDDELLHIFDLKDKKRLTLKSIEKSIELLRKKKKFNAILFSLNSEAVGNVLHIHLTSFWTFHTIAFSGMLTNKDRYLPYYSLEAGDIFCIETHCQGINAIKHVIYQQGHFNAEIVDSLTYDNEKKTVDVHVGINHGLRYTINEVHFNYCNSPDIARVENALLQKKISQLLLARLLKKKYSCELLNNETSYIQRYMVKKGFLNAKISLQEHRNNETSTVKLTFTIELKEKKTCIFFGNHFFSNEQLLDQVLVFGNSGGLLPISIVKEELYKMYHKKGFFNVSITINQEPGCIYFIIQEGTRAFIRGVELRGVDAFNEKKICNKFLYPFVRSELFDDDRLHQLLESLLSFYRSDGYWDVDILHYDLKEYRKENNFILVITIDEGTQRILKKVCVAEFPNLHTKGCLKCEKPQPFNITMLDMQREWLVHYFQEQGYVYVQISYELQEESDGIIVTWHVEGLDYQVHFGKTIVRGTTSLPFATIMRAVAYKEGEVWSKQKLESTLLRLRDLNIFETIHVYPDSIATPEQKKSVIIKLCEEEPYDVRVRLGFQQVGRNLTFRSGSSYKVGASLWYRNPFGVGDHLKFDADATKYLRNVALRYQRPWFFSVPVFTELKAYANKYTQPINIGSKEPLYKVRQEGILMSFIHNRTHFNLGTNIGFEAMETFDLSEKFARAINFQPLLIDRKIMHFFFESNILLDFLDDKIDPHRGLLTAISCKGMFPWKREAVSFFKVLFEQSCFYPLTRRMVGAFRLRFGHIFNQEFPHIFPIERFYLGGRHSLRSYDIDHVPPLGSIIDENGKRKLVPRGGRSLININFELRIHLFGPVGIVLFQDAGTLLEKSLSIAEVVDKKFVLGTGFGFQYFTPLGPLSFDFGWKWKRQDSLQSPYAWYITLGHAF